MEIVKKYLEEKVYPRLAEEPFSVVYVHTGVKRAENFIGLSALRSIYDAIPNRVRDNLENFYFLHPGLQSRLFLAIFGRLMFGGGYTVFLTLLSPFLLFFLLFDFLIIETDSSVKKRDQIS